MGLCKLPNHVSQTFKICISIYLIGSVSLGNPDNIPSAELVQLIILEAPLSYQDGDECSQDFEEQMIKSISIYSNTIKMLVSCKQC
jgi:hypothetical protein